MIEPLGAVALGSSILGGVASTAGKYIDAVNAPSQLKSTGSVQLAVLANGDKPFFEKWYVEDFEEVADTYEKTGYRVDEIHNDWHRVSLLDLFLDANVRYYFNPLQVSSVELDSDVNIPQGMLDDIRMRLANGIRLWPNTTMIAEKNDIGDFRYDNVEVDYL